MKRQPRIALLFALAGLLAAPSTAQADFGLVPGSVSAVSRLNADGALEGQAASHPYDYTVSMKFNTDAGGNSEGGKPRDIVADLPPGFFGDPLALPRCARTDFEGGTSECPASSQVGVLRVVIPGLGEFHGPIFNMVAPPGTAARFGFTLSGFNSRCRTSRCWAAMRAMVWRIEAFGLPAEVTSVSETIWGVPADPSHDPERVCFVKGKGPDEGGCPSDAPLLPFLTLPASCDAPPEITVGADSNLAPGLFRSTVGAHPRRGRQPAPLGGCSGVPFSPGISATPTTKLAASPSGLDFELKLPNQGLLGPGAIAETEPRKTVFTLPEGVSINPSLAEGVGICTPAQYAAEKIDSPAGAGCPESSKLGSVIARSPLLEEAIEGAVYLAAPYDNPFGTLAALYLVARAPERGVIVKQAGKGGPGSIDGSDQDHLRSPPPIALLLLQTALPRRGEGAAGDPVRLRGIQIDRNPHPLLGP